jgi:hypothetical protein
MSADHPREVFLMRLRRLVSLFAFLALAQPVAAATLGDGASAPRIGVAAQAYLRVPIGRQGSNGPGLGLRTVMLRQERNGLGQMTGVRAESDAVDLRLGFDGSSTFAIGGRPVSGNLERRANLSTWGTVGVVVGGLALVGVAAYAHIVHLSEKHSD